MIEEKLDGWRSLKSPFIFQFNREKNIDIVLDRWKKDLDGMIWSRLSVLDGEVAV